MTINYLPEWHTQSAVMIAWPNADTDWAENLEEVISCYKTIAAEILESEHLFIVCNNASEVKRQLWEVNQRNILFVELPINDTWTRDYGPVSIMIDGQPAVYDFRFNGWGNKFDAALDNAVIGKMVENKVFNENVSCKNMQHFVLEGGAIETDGNGTLMTTSSCMLAKTRNENLSRQEIINQLQVMFGVRQIIMLENGYIAGDDTDGHIDTLARFCNENTIIYTKCYDRTDEHFQALQSMELELKEAKQASGLPYNLVPVPLPQPVLDNYGVRLPATYANFLIMNDRVLLPVYNVPADAMVVDIFKKLFTGRKIIPVNCVPLIKQHGSLHCITMQIPVEFYNRFRSNK